MLFEVSVGLFYCWYCANITMGTASSAGVKRSGRGVVHPPHLASRLKKEYSYTSIPHLGLRGLL